MDLKEFNRFVDRFSWRTVVAGVFLVAIVLLIAYAGRRSSTSVNRPNGEAADSRATSIVSGGVVMNGSPTFNAPAQVGGQGNTINVNRAAYFDRQAKVSANQGGKGRYTTRIVIPVKPGGIWEAGTEMRFLFKLDNPCLSWTIDPEQLAFGGVMANVQTGAETNTDTIALQTTTAPRPGQDIVFEVVSSEPVNIVSAGWEPREP
jgi:hypothetical protein